MPDKDTKIILASSSPRRADLLKAIGVSFEPAPSQVNERPHPDEAPPDYIIRLARAKVIAVARKRDSGLIMGADTIVVLDGKILGKPKGTMMRSKCSRSSGRWHAVMTGVALYDAPRKRVADYDKTLVRFAQLTDKEIEWYIRAASPPIKQVFTRFTGLAAFCREIAAIITSGRAAYPLVYRLAKRLGYSFIS